MERSSIFKTRPESGEPPAARRAGSRAMTTLDFSGAAPATKALDRAAPRRPLRVMPCCGPMRMALAPEFQRFRFLYSTRRGSRPGGQGCSVAQAPEFWRDREAGSRVDRSEEHTSELQSLRHLVCRLLLE